MYRHQIFDQNGKILEDVYTKTLDEAKKAIEQHLKEEYLQELEDAQKDLKPVFDDEILALDAHKAHCVTICKQQINALKNAQSYEDLNAVTWPTANVKEHYRSEKGKINV